MKKILLISAFCGLMAYGANAQISMSEAASKALRVNKGIRSSELKMQAKEASVDRAWGRLFPTIGLDLTYTHMDKDLVLDLDPIRTAMIGLQSSNMTGFYSLETLLKSGVVLTDEQKAAYKQGAAAKLEAQLPHFKETLKEQSFPAGMVTATQPIFTGGKILAGVRASEALREVELSKASAEKDEVLLSVVNAYLGVLLAENNLKVRQDAVNTIQKHAEKAAKLMEGGLIPLHDKLRGDVALADAQRNLFEAQEKLNIAKMALKSVIDETSDVSLSDELKYKEFNMELNECIKNAIAHNHNIAQIQAGTAALKAKSDAEFADYMPTVAAYGFYNMFDHYIIPEAEPKWGVGLMAHWTIFDGFQNTNKYQESKAEAQAMEMMTSEVQRKIELLVRSLYMEMKLSAEQYKQLSASITQAEESFRLNEKRYETGLGTSLEALDARLMLESISLRRDQALKDYYANAAKLYEATGNLDEFLKFWQN